MALEVSQVLDARQEQSGRDPVGSPFGVLQHMPTLIVVSEFVADGEASPFPTHGLVDHDEPQLVETDPVATSRGCDDREAEAVGEAVGVYRRTRPSQLKHLTRKLFSLPVHQAPHSQGRQDAPAGGELTSYCSGPCRHATVCHATILVCRSPAHPAAKLLLIGSRSP